MERTYIYGITGSGAAAPTQITAADGFSVTRTISNGQLGAVVASYAGEGFDSMSKEKLVKSLLVHQRVVEAVMQRHPVLPVKFGTLLHRREEVLSLLSQGRSQFLNALSLIKDRVELEVAATWDIKRVLQELSQEKEIVQFREGITEKGAPTVADRVQLGELVKAHLDRRREHYRERVVSALGRLSLNMASHELVAEDMVVNMAFLVERTVQPQFVEALHRVDDDLADQLRFRLIGPLPPYSFCTVEIDRITTLQIEQARQSLHLDEVFGEDDIRKAYRHLAASEYRSLSGGETLAKDRFSRLGWASSTLLRYCRSRTNGAGIQQQSETGDGCHLVVALKGMGSGEMGSARFAEPAGV
ncbi:MAG: GvpL/GvpF family gas vesicle protein [Chloroflexi bacterium]|nr:GvpL/GvpF family gas vesicle protein [Chloroflexota bacterium]